MAAAQLSANAVAFTVIIIDRDGVASLSSEGNLFEITFMKEVMQDYISKLLNQKKKEHEL